VFCRPWPFAAGIDRLCRRCKFYRSAEGLRVGSDGRGLALVQRSDSRNPGLGRVHRLCVLPRSDGMGPRNGFAPTAAPASYLLGFIYRVFLWFRSLAAAGGKMMMRSGLIG